jgi:hypothetical protein
MSSFPITSTSLTTLDYILSVMDTPKSRVDFAIVFHFNEQLDFDALRLGAESARRMFPTSGSRLRGNRWVQERETLKGTITTAICNDVTSTIQNFIDRPLNPRTELPVQQLAVTSRAGPGMAVVTRFHHAVADGMSAALWLKHQFEVVRGVLQPSENESPCDTPVLKSVETPVRKSVYAFPGASDRLATTSQVRSGSRSWITIDIDADSLRKLIRRKAGFTYSDLLATCALEVYTRWNQLHDDHHPQQIGLWLPINVRRRPGEGFGNGTSRIRIYDRSSRSDSLAEKCLAVRRQIDWCSRHGEWMVPEIKGLSLLPRSLTGAFLRRNLTRQSVDMATGVFSHSDRWNSSGSGAFDSVEKIECIGLLHPFHALAINGATHRGKTWLTFTYDKGLLTRADALHLTDLYQEQIELAREQLR